MDETETADRNGRASAGGFLGVVLEGQTYKNLLYLLLAFPLGFTYGTFLSFGFVFGVVFLVVGIGLVILLVTVGGARFLARFERWLANVLLTIDLRTPDDRPRADGLRSTIKRALDAPSTWRSVGFLSVKFWFGFVGILLLFFFWSLVEMILTPLRYPVDIEFGTVNGEPVIWTVGTLPEALVAAPIGVVLGIVLLHVSNGFAYVAERIAIALLGGSNHSRDPGTELQSDDRLEAGPQNSPDDRPETDSPDRSDDCDPSDSGP